MCAMVFARPPWPHKDPYKVRAVYLRTRFLDERRRKIKRASLYYQEPKLLLKTPRHDAR